jgi:hypothetical protein
MARFLLRSLGKNSGMTLAGIPRIPNETGTLRRSPSMKRREMMKASAAGLGLMIAECRCKSWPKAAKAATST